MTNLRILNASDDCGVNDDSLIGLNLVELKADSNPKIKKINHMKPAASNLRILHAGGDSGIDDDSLIGLILIELNAYNNPKIKK